ncbi:MAG: hypothetical protein M1840_002188 [Geoglossum simile]|nr:MAG: hypothetical protein M1840_002188 [Geoglossum simile]
MESMPGESHRGGHGLLVFVRIRELQQLLLDKKYEDQKENILLAIHMYETGAKAEGSSRKRSHGGGSYMAKKARVILPRNSSST